MNDSNMVSFRDFKGQCEKCGNELYLPLLEGDLIFEDDNIWLIKTYPDYVTVCNKCGDKNQICKIFKATSYERMARGE